MYYVYILTNWNNSVLYVGVTNDLQRRLWEHKTGAVDGFTKKYNVHKLVFFEDTGDIKDALEEEKRIKAWSRKKKAALIQRHNPVWRDLSQDWE